MESHNNHSATLAKSKSQNTSLKWLGICIGLITLAVIAVTIFRVSVSTLIFGGVLLACPLMHIFMMKGGHKH